MIKALTTRRATGSSYESLCPPIISHSTLTMGILKMAFVLIGRPACSRRSFTRSSHSLSMTTSVEFLPKPYSRRCFSVNRLNCFQFSPSWMMIPSNYIATMEITLFKSVFHPLPYQAASSHETPAESPDVGDRSNPLLERLPSEHCDH